MANCSSLMWLWVQNTNPCLWNPSFLGTLNHESNVQGFDSSKSEWWTYWGGWRKRGNFVLERTVWGMICVHRKGRIVTLIKKDTRWFICFAGLREGKRWCVLKELKLKIWLPQPVVQQTWEFMEYRLLILYAFLASEQYLALEMESFISVPPPIPPPSSPETTF